MKEEKYLLKDGLLQIFDVGLGIELEEKFPLKCLPEDLEKDFLIEEGYSLEKIYFEGKQGNLQEARICKDGKPCGQYRSYYQEGPLKSEGFYMTDPCRGNGLILHGPVFQYSKEGNLLAETWFFKGERQGKVHSYYLSGALYSVLRYKNNLAHGLHEYFYENGDIKSTMSFAEGRLEGKVFLYHSGGKIFRNLQYKKGKRIGKEEEFYSSGMKSVLREYSDSGSLKKERFWSPRGILKEEYVYYGLANRLDLRRWDSQGFLCIEGKHLDGDRYEYREWDGERELSKLYYGFWDGEKVCIDRYEKGKMTLEERLALVIDKARSQEKTLKEFKEKGAVLENSSQ